MRTLLILSLLVIFVSCSSTSKKSTNPYETDGISNQDFRSKGIFRYVARKDRYEQNMSLINSISGESLDGVGRSNLKDARGSQDPITRIMANCYLGRYNEAYEISDAVYRQYKRNPSYWNQLGSCSFLSGKRNMAWLYFNKAYDLNRRYAPAVNNLAIIHMVNGKKQKALEGFKKAAKLSSMSMTPIFNLAMLYLKYGLVDSSQDLFEALNRENSKDIRVLNGLATCRLFKADYVQAVNYFGQIDEDYHERPEYGLNYALALSLNGQKSKSKDIYEDISLKKRKSFTGYYNMIGKKIGVQ